MAIKYVKSAVLPKDFPPDRGIEVAFAGRSNAGKSSLINALNNHKIAFVSGTPGKTRLLNFFEVNGKYTMVDMPGYGYAARGADEMENWQVMIEDYLAGRQSLRGLLLVMDSRREWTADEEMLKKFADQHGFGFAVALTKIDKLTRTELSKVSGALKKKSGVNDIFLVSALKKQGHEELEEWIYLNWVKPNL